MANKINDKQVKSLLKEGKSGRHSIGGGLYLRISDEGTGFWVIRYSIHGKRREITVGTYPQLSLADANAQTALVKADIKKGYDPLAERQREKAIEFKVVNNLAEDWLRDCERRLKHPHIPRRVYYKDLAPMIGGLALEHVNPRDIRAVITKIAASGRPTIANDALMYAKQLFRHGIKLDVMNHNPADAFAVTDAGGVEQSRSRALSLAEVEKVFKTLREQKDQISRENYLAVALLVLLGVRKGELTAAIWDEFDFEKAIWNIPQERNKTGVAITVPLSRFAIELLKELKLRACQSNYVFPNRRSSKNPHISPDTINAAIQKLFRQNQMPVEHFTIHDLRRTCRSLLAQAGVPGHVAERCLNHKIKGVEGIYDRYDYLEERREALQRIVSQISPLIEPQENIVSFRRAK